MAREGLNPDDPGIRLLAGAVANEQASEIVLVCSGSLPGLGTGATRLITDLREHAVAGERCLPFSFALDDNGLETRFKAAVVWPRAHLGKDFSFACIARAALLLKPGGRLLCAVRKNKGGATLGAAIRDLLGNLEILDRDRGYALYSGICQDTVDRDRAHQLLSVRHSIDHPLLGTPPLSATPGVFSRKHLDRGTQALINECDRLSKTGEIEPPDRVLDLCAGIGPLGLWAAQRWPTATITAVESNLLATACLRQNADKRGLLGKQPRLRVIAADGLAGQNLTRFELALINPPTHAGEHELRTLLTPLPPLLAGGVALFVVNRSGRLLGLLQELGATTTERERSGFTIVSARF